MRGAGSKTRCYSCIDWEMTGRLKKKHPNSSSGPNFDHHLGLCLHNQPEWVGMDGLEGDGGSTVVCTGYGGWRPHFRKSEREKLLEWMNKEKEKSFYKFWGTSALLWCGKWIVFAALIELCWKILVSESVSELIIFAVLKSLVWSVLLIKLFILSKVSAMSTCWGVLPWLSTFQPLIQWPRLICWTADLGTLSKTT